MCGIFGIVGHPDASRLTFLGLFALQHRGQESAGISVVQGADIRSVRGKGLVADVFHEKEFSGLGGPHAVGHVRYSTAGGATDANIQPLVARVGGVPVALSHNGNIVNADATRADLERQGSIFQGTADTETLLHLLARSHKPTAAERIVDAVQQLQGAITGLLLSPTHLFGYVDPSGYRPLVLGKLTGEHGVSWILASETCALDLVGAEWIRDIPPGELLSIELNSLKMESFHLPLQAVQSQSLEQSRCAFEHIYFARPDSTLWGQNTSLVRHNIGIELAKSQPAQADLVIAIPDSGSPMAMGYAAGSGIPFGVGLIRNHYVGRTFIEPTQSVRNFRVRLKLNPIREVVGGKRLVVVDDSIVRGTTSRKIIELLREAGAKEIHMRIGAPPVRFPCFYGIDTPKRKDLMAQKMSLGEMKDALQADSLGFLPVASLLKVLSAGKGPQKGFCLSCFDGSYQDKVAQEMGHPEGELRKLEAEFRLGGAQMRQSEDSFLPSEGLRRS